MKAEFDPIAGIWYHVLDENLKFMVIDADQDADLIEVQFADGSMEEFSFKEWNQFDLEIIEQPDEWVSSYEGFSDDEPYQENLEQESWEGFSDYSADEDSVKYL
jgi:hypothetical protein